MLLRLGFPRTLAGRGGVGDGVVSGPSSICLAKLKHAPAGWVVVMKDGVLQQIPGETRALLIPLAVVGKRALPFGQFPANIVEYSRAG
jgi:hypothetical protein